MRLYFFLDIVRQRTKSVELKKYAVSLMEKFGSFAHTLKTLEELDKKTREECEKLGGNPYITMLLDELRKV